MYVNPTPEEPGSGFIRYNQPPFYKGKIIQFKKEDPGGMQRFIQKNKPLAYATVPGYSMLISYYNQQEEESMDEIDLDKLDSILIGMAEFYLKCRVLPNHARFKKYITE